MLRNETRLGAIDDEASRFQRVFERSKIAQAEHELVLLNAIVVCERGNFLAVEFDRRLFDFFECCRLIVFRGQNIYKRFLVEALSNFRRITKMSNLNERKLNEVLTKYLLKTHFFNTTIHKTSCLR